MLSFTFFYFSLKSQESYTACNISASVPVNAGAAAESVSILSFCRHQQTMYSSHPEHQSASVFSSTKLVFWPPLLYSFVAISSTSDDKWVQLSNVILKLLNISKTVTRHQNVRFSLSFPQSVLLLLFRECVHCHVFCQATAEYKANISKFGQCTWLHNAVVHRLLLTAWAIDRRCD